jgi:hypothetical protein
VGRGHIRVLRAGGVGNTVSGLGTILASQALLLFLSIHTTKKRLKPQTHVLLSCAVAGVLTALLGLGVFFNLGVGIEGERFLDFVRVLINPQANILLTWSSLWGVEHCFLCISPE